VSLADATVDGAAVEAGRRLCLTIRSSGPLRRTALLSCRGRQRPLNSSVRQQMKDILITVLLAVATCATGSAHADPMCPPLRAFVASVKPSETKELTFHTLWGGNFKAESEPAAYAKRCIHNDYASAKSVCSFLMDHGAVEFAGNNVKRALSCLSPQTTFGRLVDLNRGALLAQLWDAQSRQPCYGRVP